MRSRAFVAIAVILTAAGLAPRQGAATTEAEPGTGLSNRLSRLESRLAVESQESVLLRGARIYARACAACHGRTGGGDGPAAAEMDPRPRNLTVNHYRFRSTPTGALPRPEDLERVIRKGMPGTSMSAVEELLSARELSDLVPFLYSLNPLIAEMDPPPEPVPIPAVLPEDPSRFGTGRAMYILMGCAKCHGLDGSGRGPSAKTLTDDDERPIRTTDFRFDPWKGGREPEAIVRALLTGLNGAPTPAYEDRAILITSDFVVEDPAIEQGLEPLDRDLIEVFLRGSPSSAELAEMDEEGRRSLRDRRLYDLAYHLLSFDRRKGFVYRLFRERPELEPRKP